MIIKEYIKEVIQKEIDVLLQLKNNINCEYNKAVNTILKCSGKVIISGVGKSGLIGKKISSTFSSLGIPSIFINSGDSLHGDLGIISKNDIVILISNSGETPEIIKMLDTLHEKNVEIISITKRKTTLEEHSNCVLELPKMQEADELALAPTCSTTTTLVIGDALACVISSLLNFTKEQFLLSHPGGKLGEMLKDNVKKE